MNIADYLKSTIPANNADSNSSARIASLEAELSALKESIAKIGYTVNQLDDRTFELVKDDSSAPSGDYINPIRYIEGMSVEVGKFYTDTDDVWEAIRDGIPRDFADKNFFDIIV